jgi:hypothetical protein
MSFYPAVLFDPDANGIVGCTVPDLLINASGGDRESALADAVRSMDELLGDMARGGEPFPESTPVEKVDTSGGVLVLLHVRLPAAA